MHHFRTSDPTEGRVGSKGPTQLAIPTQKVPFASGEREKRWETNYHVEKQSEFGVLGDLVIGCSERTCWSERGAWLAA